MQLTTRTSSPPRATISIELFLDPLNQPTCLGLSDIRSGGLVGTHPLCDGFPEGGFCSIRINNPELVLPETIGDLIPQLELLLMMDIHRARARNGNPDISLQ